MAIQRAANEGFLTVSLKLDKKKVVEIISSKVISNQGSLKFLNKGHTISLVKIFKAFIAKRDFQINKGEK